jgi:methyl-accepting chemotaxis protein
MNNQRKTIIVNRKLQYQGALMTAAVVILAVNFLIMAGSVFPVQVGLKVNFSSSQYLYLAICEITVITLTFYLSLKSSHKIMGPVYAFGRELKKLSEGDLTANVVLRPGDAFEEEAEQINVGLTEIRTRINVIKTIATGMQAQSDSQQLSEDVKKLNQELDKLITVKEDSA